MKTHWLLIVAILGAAGAAILVRAPSGDGIAAEQADRAIPESAVAALQGAGSLPEGPSGPLPPGHPKIDTPGAAGELPEGQTEAPDDDVHRGMGTAQPGAGPAPAAEVKGPEPGQVPKATGPGAKQIAELFSERSSLAGTKVRVRGQVVKVAAGIMGTNFVHLRDGTGSAKDADHDLTVTMDTVPSLGQILLVEGVVKIDHNLGAGYLYPVLLDKAVSLPE